MGREREREKRKKGKREREKEVKKGRTSVVGLLNTEIMPACLILEHERNCMRTKQDAVPPHMSVQSRGTSTRTK